MSFIFSIICIQLFVINIMLWNIARNEKFTCRYYYRDTFLVYAALNLLAIFLIANKDIVLFASTMIALCLATSLTMCFADYMKNREIRKEAESQFRLDDLPMIDNE